MRDAPAFSVQYHPEAGPGPHDTRYLFAEFAALMDGRPLDQLPPVPAHLHGLPEPATGWPRSV